MIMEGRPPDKNKSSLFLSTSVGNPSDVITFPEGREYDRDGMIGGEGERERDGGYFITVRFFWILILAQGLMIENMRHVINNSNLAPSSVSEPMHYHSTSYACIHQRDEFFEEVLPFTIPLISIEQNQILYIQIPNRLAKRYDKKTLRSTSTYI